MTRESANLASSRGQHGPGEHTGKPARGCEHSREPDRCLIGTEGRSPRGSLVQSQVPETGKLRTENTPGTWEWAHPSGPPRGPVVGFLEARR